MAKNSKASKAARASSIREQSKLSSGGTKGLKAQPLGSPKAKSSYTGSKLAESPTVPGEGHRIGPNLSKAIQNPPLSTTKSDRTMGKATSTSLFDQPKALDSTQAVRCAENIVLLERITALPGSISHNVSRVRPAKEQQKSQRTLSFEEESELVTTLALISGIWNDTNHITAVSLEELPAGAGCKVLIAINTPAPGSMGVQKRIEKGFRQIFGQLAKLSSGMSLVNSILGLRERQLEKCIIVLDNTASSEDDLQSINRCRRFEQEREVSNPRCSFQ